MGRENSQDHPRSRLLDEQHRADRVLLLSHDLLPAGDVSVGQVRNDCVSGLPCGLSDRPTAVMRAGLVAGRHSRSARGPRQGSVRAPLVSAFGGPPQPDNPSSTSPAVCRTEVCKALRRLIPEIRTNPGFLRLIAALTSVSSRRSKPES